MSHRRHKSDDLQALRACHVWSKHIATENLIVSRTLQSPRLDAIESNAQQRVKSLLVDLENLKLRVRNLETLTRYQALDSDSVVITGAPLVIR
jgi:hypothetical protein